MEPNPASSARGIATLGPSVTQHLAQADYTRSRPHLYEEPIGTVASSSRSSTHPTRSSSLTKIPQPGQSAEPSDTREASEPVTRSMALEQPICSSTPYGTPQYQPSIAASSSFGPRAGSIPGNKSLPESLYGFDPNDHLPQASSPREASAGSQIGILTRKRGNTTKAPSHTASREPSGVKPEPRSVSKPTRMDQPQLPSQKNAKITPATAMYYTSIPFHTLKSQQSLRAHTGTLVGDRIWFIGGVNAKHCWREVAYYDTGSLEWNTVETGGEQLPPLRAHTTTLVGDKLYIFGGGDGPTYSNEVWMFDTVSYRFSQPTLTTPKSAWPPPRRAHTTVLYRNFLVVFGGGNGQAALNDVWALDVSDPDRLTWHEWQAKGTAPQKKGYHTANLVGDRMVVFGGSDGHASFADVHILNLRTLTWTLINTELKFNRLSHTSTLVGSYLFMLGGHNGQSYAQDVLLFNLVTLQWESKHPGGVPPPGRGYHIALLHDARIYVQGGYNGVSVFGDLWALELGASAYLPQVTTFEIDETVAVAAAAAAA